LPFGLVQTSSALVSAFDSQPNSGELFDTSPA